MSFSTEWNTRYQSNTHMSIWPWSDLVSLVLRHKKPDGPHYKVLELGVGAGANIRFFKHYGVTYSGIDGSPSIIGHLKKDYPEYAKNLIVGDFTQTFSCDDKFDLIVDRASITHNSTQAIRNALKLVFSHLKTDGLFMGVDWFGTGHSYYNLGEQADDRYSRKNFTSGPFAGVGLVHFSDEAHLRDLFSDFKIQVLECVQKTTKIPQPLTLETWNIVVSL